MTDPRAFLEELKRRKVVRVGVVYLAVVWAAVQVTDVFVPALGLPEVLITAVAVLAIVGFPVALALAWAFDVTPEGVKRAAPGAEAGPTRWIGLSTLVLAGVLLAVGFFAGSLVRSGSTASGLDRTAVAVLPFDARGVMDEVGFVDGVHDDILTQLSRIGDLRVTSRTSVQAYRGTTKNVRTIAAELGVGAVLEGGVQRTADRVRINVQLIDGATDEHLWAETFDRELTAENVFAIQSEIARAVAAALEATLTSDDEAALAVVPTADLEALDLYHRGRQLFTEVGDPNPNQAIAVLEEAVARDPGFAAAWSELTRARSWAIRQGQVGDTMPAREAMERTLALASGTVEAALAVGHYRYYARGDYDGALSALREAAAGQSGDTELMFAISNVLRRRGAWDEARTLYEEIARLAPRDARIFYDLGWVYKMERDWTAAGGAYRRYQELMPEATLVRSDLADLALFGAGDTVRARALVSEWMAIDSSGLAPLYRSQLSYFQRDHAALAITLHPDVIAGSSFGTYNMYPDGPADLWLARMAWVLGDTARARTLGDRLEAAYLARTPALRPGGNVIPEGGDVFGIHATRLLLRAWAEVFHGRVQEARRLADEAIARHSLDKDATDGVLFRRQRALILLASGDLDGAIADLRLLLSRPGLTTAWELRLDPIYDPLRGRPDFQALVAGG